MTQGKKRHSIALLIDETENAYQSVLCKGISEYAYDKKVNLMIFSGRALNSPFSFDYQFNVIYGLIGENLSSNKKLQKNINGITISPKKNFCIIKILDCLQPFFGQLALDIFTSIMIYTRIHFLHQS